MMDPNRQAIASDHSWSIFDHSEAIRILEGLFGSGNNPQRLASSSSHTWRGLTGVPLKVELTATGEVLVDLRALGVNEEFFVKASAVAIDRVVDALGMVALVGPILIIGWVHVSVHLRKLLV